LKFLIIQAERDKEQSRFNARFLFKGFPSICISSAERAQNKNQGYVDPS